ncbi:MAG: Ig-like domain-containing protein [Desulfobacteraceae bacterium]|nr:Ig-like domain-containing protein [Desulfobacteraceae bacterium]
MGKWLQIVFIAVTLTIFALSGCGEKEEPSEPKATEKKPGTPTAEVVTTYPGDGEALWEPDHPIYIHFSEPVRPGDFSFSISPDPGQWNVSWENEGKEAVLNHAEAFRPGTGYAMTVFLGEKPVKSEFQFTVFGPSSLQLIEKDQQKGELDIDTAWLYRMQTLFEPGKLPEAYQSDTPIKDADVPIRRFFRVRDKLSKQTLEKLRPYLVRPTHPDSIYYESMTRNKEDSSAFFHWPKAAHADDSRPVMPFSTPCITTDILLIWPPQRYKAAANNASFFIDEYNMYQRFKKLMGRDILDDYDALFQTEGPNDQAKNGGDGRIDIYMIPSSQAAAGGFGGMCISTAWESAAATNVKSSAYILIDRNLKGDDLAATLAHELFHAFQCAFDPLDDIWWEEATAVWAEDYIDSTWNFEHEDIQHAFNRPKNRLKALNLVNENHEYGIYIYPYFLSKEYGDEVIADIWRACETKSSLDAIDEAVPDGLDESLKQFAIPTIDYGKYEGRIRKPKESNMPLFKHHEFKEIILRDPGKPVLKSVTVPPLGASYVLVKNRLKNPDSTPMVRFDLKSFANNDDLTIQAIIDPNGDARKEDWTGREERELCQNKAEEKFEEIAIVVTNKNRDPMAMDLAEANPQKHGYKAELDIEIDAEGCTEAVGSATITAHSIEQTHTKWEETLPGGNVKRTQTDLKSDIRATIRLRFEKEGADYNSSTNTVTQHFDITERTVTSFSVNGREYRLSYNYWADRECSCTKKITEKTLRWNSELEDSGGLSITFDSETLKAKYVTLPSLTIYADLQGTSKTTYSGCCGSSGDENKIQIDQFPFHVGSVKSKGGEQLRPEADRMKRLGQDSQQFAQKIMDSMGKLSEMDEEQAEKFYENLEKQTEEFEKVHDLDQLARDLENKAVPEDLLVTSGGGEKSFGGGGKREERKKIENGFTSTTYDLKWRINLKDKPSSDN